MRLADAHDPRMGIALTLRAMVIGIVAAMLCAMGGGRAAAQDVVLQAGARLGATRAQLDSSAGEAERLARADGLSSSDREAYRLAASLMRERLVEGDFQVGDQIALEVRGQDSLTATFVVREGRLLALPMLSEIQLRGVLRSELRQYLEEQIGRYVRNPTVHATALLRIAVLGEVRNPGFYRVAADVPLSEALMAAGGPTAAADLKTTHVKRDTKDVLAPGALRGALASGATLDRLSLRSGDEIVVGARRGMNWSTVLQSVTVIVSVTALLLTRHR